MDIKIILLIMSLIQIIIGILFILMSIDGFRKKHEHK